ncbi:MAG TPA: HAD family hydrolase [bacterium]|nr:HAD family hydrolase [bacterium]
MRSKLRISELKVVFFDLDGTLTDYEASVDYATTKLWERIEDVCPLDLYSFLRAQWDFLAELEEKDAKGEIPRTLLKDRRARTEQFLRSLGPGLVERFEDVGEVYTRYRQESLTLYPGTVEVLADLGRRYALGVITEGDGQMQRTQLKEAGLVDFDYVVISDEVDIHKPDSTLYRRACEMAGVLPRQAALVGDRIDWDIVPAAKIGMLTVLCRQQRHYRKHEVDIGQADYTIGNIKELLAILK